MRADELKAVLNMLDEAPPPPAAPEIPANYYDMTALVVQFLETAPLPEKIQFLRFLAGLVARAFGGAEKTVETPSPAPKPAPVAQQGYTSFGEPTLPPEIVRAREPQKPEEAAFIAAPKPQPTPLPLFDESEDVENYISPNLPTN